MPLSVIVPIPPEVFDVIVADDCVVRPPLSVRLKFPSADGAVAVSTEIFTDEARSASGGIVGAVVVVGSALGVIPPSWMLPAGSLTGGGVTTVERPTGGGIVTPRVDSTKFCPLLTTMNDTGRFVESALY